MTHQTKDPERQPWHKRILGGQLNLIAAGLVLLALFGLNRMLDNWRGPWGSYPLAPFAVGEMAKFSFDQAGAPAPNIIFLGPQGQELSLASFYGDVVLVNLWATWCAPCVEELPSLNELAGELGENTLRVVAINMDMDGAEVAGPFLEELGLEDLTLYRDNHLLMSTAMGVSGIPLSVLYDEGGREIGRLHGSANWASPEAVALILEATDPSKEQ